MKWLLILFATYMLVLPCIPCNAAEVCCSEEHACAAEDDGHSDEKSCAAEDDGHSDEKLCAAEEDRCPEAEASQHSCPDGQEEGSDQHQHSATCPCCPSFSCNTCHSIVVAGLVLVDPIIPALRFENISFTDKPLANFSAIIWQPPKVL